MTDTSSVTSNDKIVWINHAGYELQSSGVRIVVDPWMSGRAFANGWSLISETAYTYENFRGVDYIWFSHEHPDHFSPGDLRKIDAEVRSTITVLFQHTEDKRVINHCTKLGFKVRELQNGETVALKNGITIQVGTVWHDSWSFIKTPTTSYLNMNDCVHETPAKLYASIRSKIAGDVDVLFTQFSYANWTGNPEDNGMARYANTKLRQVEEQVAAFSPKVLIPFASFVWFSAAENFHMNRGANSIASIYERFSRALETVVLYPGDTYAVGQPHASVASVERYSQDAARITGPLPMPETPLTAEKLLELADAYQKKISDKNAIWTLRPLAWVGKMKPVSIRATDLGCTFEYSIFSGLQRLGDVPADLELTSAVLGMLFTSGYASDTIFISGRLRQNNPAGMAMLSRNFVALRYNEAGAFIPKSLLNPRFIFKRLSE